MKVLGRLILLQKKFFSAALSFTLLSAFLQLYWNSVLAGLIDRMGNSGGVAYGEGMAFVFGKAACVCGGGCS